MNIQKIPVVTIKFLNNANKAISQAASSQTEKVKQEKPIGLVNKKVLCLNKKNESKEVSDALKAQFLTTPQIVTQKPLSIQKILDEKASNLQKIFSSIVKEFHIKLSTNPEVIAIEEELRRLGVLVTFADDTKLAKKILEACQKLASKGISLPKKLFIMTPQQPMIFAYTTGTKKGAEKEAVVFLHKNLTEIVENKVLEFVSSKGVHKMKLPPVEHIFYHEIGHFNHLQQCPDLSTSYDIYQDFIRHQGPIYIKQNVSIMADTEPTGKEFVAEVFAGLMQGKNFPEKIMSLYKSLNGPLVP